MTMFSNRYDAGRRLAEGLRHLADEPVVVLGLPRGGVPVAFEIARVLNAPLDVIVVRKLGVPWHPELAMGAIGEEGVRVLDHHVIARAGVSDASVRAVDQREREVLEARIQRLRRGRRRVPLRGRVAVVVDDGIATGSTARAACEVARRLGAARVVLASPVAPAGTTAEELAADELVCCATPLAFQAVGNYYRDFSPTTDQEVVALLGAAPAPADQTVDEETEIALPGVVHLRGHLHVPAGATGVVVFAHGSGSSRLSPRNRAVAQRLQAAGLGTLLVDLLTAREEADPHNVFDIPLLGSRLTEVGRWVLARPEAESCALGYFGASTGAGAALWAAAQPGSPAAAVVSRGGRPDLAGDRLPWVKAPTLLIVGGADPVVLDLNREAQARMQCQTRLVVVPGATHLFEEPGTLDEVARLAAMWFTHLIGSGAESAKTHGVPMTNRPPANR
jgi:putative phosphoribosyl transferase